MADNVLVVGSGGREHALAGALAQSSHVGKVFCNPGNPGTEGEKIQRTTAVSSSDQSQLAQWCKENLIKLVVVGPEAPLADGLADTLAAAHIPCFGPSAAAARIESSKVFAKEFMTRHDIPTARFSSFTDADAACAHIDSADYDALVVKASGLAAGKGVIVGENRDEAKAAVRLMIQEKKCGAAGETIVIEEYLEGEEISVIAFTDGQIAVRMPPAQDHKRLLEGNKGPNTGGMGAYAPCPLVTDATLEVIQKEILQKAVDGLRQEGCPFVGALYAGLMLTKQGPKVLEYNCRFGDPETQVILRLLKSDLFLTMHACAAGQLHSAMPEWHSGLSAAAVVLASEGYPGSYPKGRVISGVDDAPQLPGVQVFHAGTKRSGEPVSEKLSGDLVTAGGRVLAVSAVADTLQGAIEQAYAGINCISFEGAQFRKDIGASALKTA